MTEGGEICAYGYLLLNFQPPWALQVCSTTPWQPPPPSAEGTFDSAALSEQNQSTLHIVPETNVVVSTAFFHEVYRVAATEAIRLAEEHCKHLVVESVPSTPATPMDGAEDEYVIIHTSAPSTPHDFGDAPDDKRDRGKGKGKGKKGKKARGGNGPAAEEEARGSRKGSRKQKGKKGRGQAEHDENTGDSGRKGGKKSRKGRRRGDASSSDDNDSESISGAARRSATSRSRGAGTADGRAGRKSSPAKAQTFLSRRAFRELLTQSILKPLCTSTENGEETAQRLAASLQSMLYNPCLGMYNVRCERLRSSVFKAASTDSRRVRQDIDRHFDAAWVEFAASVAGLDGLLKTSRAGAPVFSSGGSAHRQLKRILARSSVCTNALALLLCSVGLQLDPTVLPPKVTSAAAASELSVAELRRLVKAISPLCGPLASSIGEWLAVAQAGGAGAASSNERCVCSQGLDDLAASIADHADLYIKFPKTSGKVLKHFVFKQRAVLAQRMSDANVATQAQEGDDIPSATVSLLSLVLQFLLTAGSGLYVQIALGSEIEAGERQLVDALVSAALLSQEGAPTDEGKEESEDEAGELGSLISSLYRELVSGENGSHREGLSTVDALERARQLALELGSK